jgi:hypothetical protein
MNGIEYRVTCQGLNPRYYTDRYQAWATAQRALHLHPTIWWRWPGGPWIDLTVTDPKTVSTP